MVNALLLKLPPCTTTYLLHILFLLLLSTKLAHSSRKEGTERIENRQTSLNKLNGIPEQFSLSRESYIKIKKISRVDTSRRVPSASFKNQLSPTFGNCSVVARHDSPRHESCRHRIASIAINHNQHDEAIQ